MIKIFNTRNEFDNYRNSLSNDKKIGLVPTMGNLHEGHISLLKSSIAENEISIMTIFVNPKQFGPNEDFNKYPRTLEQDLTKIENLILPLDMTGKDVVVFAPKSNDEIYPENFSSSISVGDKLKNKLCGKVRPIHFDGVTTVVYRLFSIIKPTNAYFGQKDYQQCVVIQKMISDFEIPIKMVIKPIVRNSYGLALSSRNQYLTSSELEEALHLPKTLRRIEQLILTKQDYKELVQTELKNSKWEYLEILDADNLNEITESTQNLVIAAVYKLNQTRLLDNILVKNVR